MKLSASLAAIAFVIAATPTLAQDAKAGEAIFKKCAACHQVGAGAENKIGPVLTGIIGRPAASYAGFKYSKSMAAAGAAGHVWDADSIFEYVSNPTKYLRALLDDPRAKAKMRFKLKSQQDRRDVIAYLASFKVADAVMQGSEEITTLAPSDTPGKMCVTNGAHQQHLFIVETADVRTVEMLAPGGMFCADTDQGGKISVFEQPDDLEGCTRLMAPDKSNTLVRYMEFDRCEWSSHSQ
ncbi:c-type cytochrome [Profundibacter sp.]